MVSSNIARQQNMSLSLGDIPTEEVSIPQTTEIEDQASSIDLSTVLEHCEDIRRIVRSIDSTSNAHGDQFTCIHTSNITTHELLREHVSLRQLQIAQQRYVAYLIAALHIVWLVCHYINDDIIEWISDAPCKFS